MHSVFKLLLGTIAVAGVAAAAYAQGMAEPKKVTVNDPVGPLPDPSHLPVTLPKDIKWTGDPTKQQTAIIFGDPSKPGLYGIVYKWMPGSFSRPHFHDKERTAYVISGTWWVSSSNVYDESLTYPVHAGSVAIDRANTVHWDGARTGEKEPAVLELVGMGPVSTVQVDEQGKPLPPRPPAAAR